MNRIDITGQNFARLTVIKRSKRDKWRKYLWLCKCNCGQETLVTSFALKSGHTKSCGCLKKEGRPIIHGHFINKKHSHTYSTWSHMIQRCTNKKNKDYSRYGGRGITIYEKWLKFQNFLEDMGIAHENCQIDRINNNLGYYPGNCRWVTAKQNCRNRRTNRLITFNGETKCLMDWTEEFNVKYDLVRYRLNRGWSIEQALTIPISSKRG